MLITKGKRNTLHKSIYSFHGNIDKMLGICIVDDQV